MSTQAVTLDPGDVEVQGAPEAAPQPSGPLTLGANDVEIDDLGSPDAHTADQTRASQAMASLGRGSSFASDKGTYLPNTLPPAPGVGPAPLKAPSLAQQALNRNAPPTSKFATPQQPAPQTTEQAIQQAAAPPAPVLAPGDVEIAPGPRSARQIAGSTPMRPEAVTEAVAPSPAGMQQMTPEQSAGFEAQQWENPTGFAAGPQKAMRQVAEGGIDLARASQGSGMTPVTDPARAVHGAAEVAAGAGYFGTGLFAAEAMPVTAAGKLAIGSTLKAMGGYLAGVAAGKGASFAAKEAGLSPQLQEDANTLGFFLPTAAFTLANVRTIGATGPEGSRAAGFTAFGGRVGVGAATSPEAVGFGAKVGPFSVSAVKPRGTGVQFGTEMRPQLPEPGEVFRQQQESAATDALTKAAALDQASANVMQGKPPVPPPPTPPMPSGMDQGVLKPDTIQRVAGAISMAPPEMRGQLVQEAHQNLAKWILNKGTVVGPDGKVLMAKTPEQAASVAAKIVNEEVARQDQQRNEAAKAQKEQEKQAAASAKAASTEGAKEEVAGPPTLQQRAQTVIEANEKAEPKDLAKTLVRQIGIPYAQALGMVKEARAGKAPAIEAGGNEVVPEEKEEVDRQMAELQGGQVKAIHLPPDAKYIPALPEGINRVDVKNGPGAGTYLYDGKQVRAATIKAAAKAGTHEDLLAPNEKPVTNHPAVSATPETPAKPADNISNPPETAVAEAPPNITPDRRQNTAQRQRVAEMSPEQMRRTLLTSEKTGIPNRRAFEEAEHAQPAAAVAMSDADGLKALNDKFGYEAGDQLLKAKAEALQQAGLDAYHEKGDEFMYRGESTEDLQGKLEKARDILRNRVIEVETTDGKTLRFKGADFSYGAGATLAESESGLHAHKSSREARGERARGELRGITETGPAEGEKPDSAPAREEVAKPKYEYGNTQAVVPEGSDAHSAILELQRKVSDGDLAGKGKDVDEPHVTVRYGIQGDDLAGIRTYLQSQAPFEAKLGKTDIFPPTKNSDGAAVVNAPVESPELHRMNAEIAKHGDFKESDFPEYKPHVTVAYVKPEAAEKYRGMTEAQGKGFPINAVDISDRNGNKETVALKGAAPAAAAATTEPTKTYEAEVQRFAGDPKARMERVEAENRRQAEQFLAEKFPGQRIGSAGRVENVQPAKAAATTTLENSERTGGRGQSPEPSGAGALTKGARVTFTDKTGEYAGTVAHVDDRIARVKLDGDKPRSLTVPLSKLKAEVAPTLTLEPPPADIGLKRTIREYIDNLPVSQRDYARAAYTELVEAGGGHDSDGMPREITTPAPDVPYRERRALEDVDDDLRELADKTVARPSKQGDNVPNGATEPERPAGIDQAGGGRPSSDLRGGHREAVAGAPSELREEPRGVEPAEADHPAESPAVREPAAPVSESGAGSGSGEGSGAGADNSPGLRGVDRQAELAKSERIPPKNRDWFEHPANWTPPGGEVTRTENNLRAIEIIRSLEKEPRKLTDEEKQALANYVGWGALQNVFDPYRDYSDRAAMMRWRGFNERLQKLVSEEEFAAARASTMNAHYTAPEVVRWMWSIAQRLGFKGGVILEPSLGTGNFFGMMPKSIRGKSQAIGNELDKLTFAIAQQLYPGATLHNLNFRDLVVPNDSVDLAIGNPPFGDEVLYDPKYPKLKAFIHDYFFLKSLDKLRPGGVLMYVTGTGTMDRGNAQFRRLMGDKAHLVTALRLPMGTFLKNAGTAVSTDILILQRKPLGGEAKAGESFLDTHEVDVPNVKDPTRFEKVRLNEYWQNHPENMLGIPRAGTKMYGSIRFELQPFPDTTIDKVLEKATAGIPKGLMLPSDRPVGATQVDTPTVFASQNLLDGQYTVDKGKVLQNIGGKLVKPAVVENKDGSVNPTKMERLRGMIGLRDELNGLLREMKTLPNDDPSNAVIAASQKRLQKSYTAYTKKYGALHSVGNSQVFRDDAHYPRLLSLEQYDKATKIGTPAPIFTTRTILPAEPLRSVSPNPTEALHQILADRGYADLPLMAQLQGKPLADVAKVLRDQGLVFRDPTSGRYELRETYLSGYVRDKLKDAEAAVAQGNADYAKNVEELKKVIPEDIPIWTGDENTQIAIRPGATWIPLDLFPTFGKEILGTPLRVQVDGGAWRAKADHHTAEVTNTYGTKRMYADELFQLALNMKRPIIRDTFSDGTSVINREDTAAAVIAQETLVNKFAEWAAQHKTWAPKLERIYNDTMNNLVRPQHDGSHLVLHGANTEITPRKHQLDAAWRILQEGRALVGHEVGAGKTMVYAIAAVEGRRLGMWHKPMIAVPNHLTEQTRREIIRLYPAANVLSPSEDDFSAKNRQRLMSRIATGDFDVVLLAHSQFDQMDISAEYQRNTFQQMMDELADTIQSLKGDRDNQRTVKQLEKAKAKLQSRMDSLKDLKADKTINFDDLGVDQLFVDEAHEYKNLAFYTKMTRVAGLGQGDAKKAFRLKMKTDYLQAKHNGRGVVFGTGTPLQNTMAEINAMTKYVAPDLLEKAGIRFFDDWAGNFGKVVSANELSADGQSYKTRDKFIRFVNVPELMRMFHAFADIKTAAELNLPRPEIEGGKPTIVSVKPSADVLDYVKSLVERAESLKGKPPAGKGSDNMLAVVTDGRKAATDLRLISDAYPDDPDSKLNKAIADVYSEWKEGTAEKTTHLVFLDMFRAFDKVRNSEGDIVSGPVRLDLYRDMVDKLVARGIPADQIAVIQDYADRVKRQALFEDMNRGKVRVLIGSTKKMGAGMNAQRLMKSLHHVDLPWKPGELEQRNGRILRQGNTNKSVRIYNYVTEKTFDAYMAQTLQGKAEFISQVMSGQSKARVMADLAADQVLSLEEMKVAASGNPDVKKKFDLELQIQHLRLLQRAHESQQRDTRYQAQTAHDQAGRIDRDLNNAKQAADSVAKFSGEDGKGLQVEVDGKTFTDRKNLFDHLKAMGVPPVNFEMVWSGIPVWVEPMEIAGIKGAGSVKSLNYQARFMSSASTAPEFSMESLGLSLEARVRQLQDRVETLTTSLEGARERAEKLDKLGESSPFPQAKELEKAKEELTAVEKRLGLGNVNDGHLDAGQQVIGDVDASPDAMTTSDTGDEEEDEDAPGSNGVTLRSSLFGLDLLAQAAAKQGKAFWKSDIEPVLSKFAEHTREAAVSIAHVIYPRFGANQDAQDILGEARGMLERHLTNLEHLDGGLEEYFERMPRDAQLAFIDRYKLGVGQPDPNLQRIEDIMRKIDDRSLQMAQVFKPTLTAKQDHFRVIWKVIPFTQAPAGGSAQFAKSRRPWQGDKGFMKRSTLDTISEGINAGGVPVTTNPWKLFTLAQASIMKYISAQQAWAAAKPLGLRKYVKRGTQPPDGWVKINDRIAEVYFPEQALSVDLGNLPVKMVGPKGHQKEWVPKEDIDTHRVMSNPGSWYAEAGFGRLLNNYLSRDYIRQSAIGSTLMWAKNLSTAIELSLSPFHAIFETIEAMGSQFGLGAQRIWNNGVRLGDGQQMTQGMREIMTAVAAPYLMSRTGGNALRYFRDPQQFFQTPRGLAFLKQFPNAPAAIKVLFDGGLTMGVQRDFRFDPQKSMIEAAKERNYVGALLRVVPWVNTMLMKPLFEAYIPRLKMGLALQLYSQQTIENQRELANGDISPTEIGRRIADTVENRFGEMNFNNIYWNNTVKSAFQLIFRSVTWKLGNWRGLGTAVGAEAGRAFSDPVSYFRSHGKPGARSAGEALPRIGLNQAWLLGLAFTTAVIGTIAARFWTHRWPWEWAIEDREEGYSVPGAIALETIHPRTGRYNRYTGKPERLSLPTGLKDFEHAFHAPGNYLRSSLSGFVGHTYDTWENRDAFKNYVYDPHGTELQKVQQIFAYNAPKPISFENWSNEYGARDLQTRILRGAGFSSAGADLDMSPAEERLRDLHFHEPQTPEQVQQMHYEDLHPTPQQVRRAMREKRMDYAQRLFKGLTYADARDVYDNYASPAERAQLHAMLREKRANAIKNHGRAAVQ